MRELAEAQPVYRDSMPAGYVESCYVPAVRAGKAITLELPEGSMFFTWLRSLEPLTAMPRPEQWANEAGFLWIVDMVPSECASPMRAAREMFNAMIECGAAREGEPAFFYRHRSRRYGHATVRKS